MLHLPIVAIGRTAVLRLGVAFMPGLACWVKHHQCDKSQHSSLAHRSWWYRLDTQPLEMSHRLTDGLWGSLRSHLYMGRKLFCIQTNRHFGWNQKHDNLVSCILKIVLLSIAVCCSRVLQPHVVDHILWLSNQPCRSSQIHASKPTLHCFLLAYPELGNSHFLKTLIFGDFIYTLVVTKCLQAMYICNICNGAVRKNECMA